MTFGAPGVTCCAPPEILVEILKRSGATNEMSATMRANDQIQREAGGVLPKLEIPSEIGHLEYRYSENMISNRINANIVVKNGCSNIRLNLNPNMSSAKANTKNNLGLLKRFM
jgi:hypothetical protein